ncbi:16S rRNA (cytosine(1402)-N(4))-methyltransferase, partial [Anaplasma bovis]|uniref:16S rRNA (cytosine(1402)-N(4))-methyltransferase n=1 Tax=Anaplasma bovis TaxID=186733 RepID=UPI002FF157AA
MHKPVLLAEMLEILSPVDGGVYIDATFGAGGYTKGILDSAQCTVYCIDRDAISEEFFFKLSQEYKGRTHFFLGKFSDLQSIIGHFNIEK